MRVVSVVTGPAYQAMHELTKPLFRERWGVDAEAVESLEWPNTKVRLMMQGPLLLIDADVLPIAMPDWDELNPRWETLAGVHTGGQYNTGVVYCPEKLSNQSLWLLFETSKRELKAPMWEQDALQSLPWRKLDPRWNHLASSLAPNPHAWAIHFAGTSPAQKLAAMKGYSHVSIP